MRARSHDRDCDLSRLRQPGAPLTCSWGLCTALFEDASTVTFPCHPAAAPPQVHRNSWPALGSGSPRPGLLAMCVPQGEVAASPLRYHRPTCSPSLAGAGAGPLCYKAGNPVTSPVSSPWTCSERGLEIHREKARVGNEKKALSPICPSSFLCTQMIMFSVMFPFCTSSDRHQR